MENSKKNIKWPLLFQDSELKQDQYSTFSQEDVIQRQNISKSRIFRILVTVLLVVAAFSGIVALVFSILAYKNATERHKAEVTQSVGLQSNARLVQFLSVGKGKKVHQKLPGKRKPNIFVFLVDDLGWSTGP